MILWPDLFYALLAFASGSVPWSWLLGKLKGVDIRKEGSGNTGATNLFRVCGKGLGLAGMLLDILKGALPVLAAKYGIEGLAPQVGQWAVAAAAVLAVLGHVFSPWLKFKGGKGVATGLGVLLVLSPLTVSVGVAVFILVLSLTRFVSLGSIIASCAMIPAVFILNPDNPSVQFMICLVAVLIVLRHISNIKRLLQGEENRFSFRSADNG